MELTKKLNLDTTPLNAGLGDMSYANNIVATLTNIINEPGFKLLNRLSTSINVDINRTIVGIVSVPNGFVVFGISTNLGGAENFIMYFENDSVTATKTITSTFLNFRRDRPIFGEYTYNYKKELIISFSEGTSVAANETRIINVSAIAPTSTPVVLNLSDVELLNLIPNIQYPKLAFEVIADGNNKIGTYQIAIAYKLLDGTYTNFSPLHKTIHIIANTKDDSRPGISISKSIKITSSYEDTKYAECKLGITYKEETAELAYETKDILVSVLHTGYILSNITSLNSIALDIIVLSSISYIKDEAHCSFNANLIRGNVVTIDHTGLDEVCNNIANNCAVSFDRTSLSDPFVTDLSNFKYFREEEVYALYLGVLDYKGNLVNSYPIKWKAGDHTVSFDNGNSHQIPLDTVSAYRMAAIINVTLPVNIEALLGVHNTIIKQFCILYAEHTTENSKVLAQAFVSRDTHVSNISDNEYHCPFKSHTKLRLYTFDYLFNKRQISNVDIKAQNKLGGLNGILDRDINEDNPNNLAIHITKVYKYNNAVTRETAVVTPLAVEYIELDSSIQNNTASDSFYRTTLPVADVNKLLGGDATKADGGQWLDESKAETNAWARNGWQGAILDKEVAIPSPAILTNRFGVVNIHNKSVSLYSNLYNQTLVICSPIHTKGDRVIYCTGDTYYGNFTFRMTAPQHGYFYGNSANTTDGYVNKVIISINMEGRYNIQGRYSGVNTYQKVFNIAERTTVTEIDRKALFMIPYKYDNFINTSEGKGYANALHENGLAVNYYTDKLKGIYVLINRLIRSNANNSESLTIGWRYYSAKNYKDVPLQRGAIKVLSSTDRYLYIQQEYGLRVASVQDKLSAESTTFLGSSDLFDREPVEVLYDKHGYISCCNKFGTTLTPLGYVVIDALKAKIFLVNGLEAVELTKDLVKDWFTYNVNVIGDNPFHGKGIHVTYDNKHSRLILTYKDEGNKPFTISYSFIRGGFVSFHSYNGAYSFYNNLGTYQVSQVQDKGIIYKMNDISKAIYLEELVNSVIVRPVKESVVQLVWNPESSISKLLQEVEWQTLINTKGVDGTLYHYDATISKLMLHNDTQCTGIINVNDNIEWFDATTGTLKAGKWFFNAINDIVVNDYLPFIKDFIDIQSNNLSNSKEWFDISKFISTFAYVTMIYDNYYYNSIDRDWYANDDISHTRKQANFVLNNVNIKAIKDNR